MKKSAGFHSAALLEPKKVLTWSQLGSQNGFRDSPELRWDLQTDDPRTLMSGHDHKCIYIYIHKINSLKVLDGMGSIKFQGIHGLHYFQGPDAAVENLVVQS